MSLFSSLFNFKFNFINIKGDGNTVSQDVANTEPSGKLLQSLTTQLSELQKSSPYQINAIEVNKSNIHLQEDLIKRDTLIAEICNKLNENKCVILNGDILIGKTCLAQTIGLARPELNPWLLQLYHKTDFNPSALIPVIAESGKCRLLIIDGLPDYDIEITEALCNVICNAIANGMQILITSRSFNQVIASKYKFEQITVPVITATELRASVPQCSEELAHLIISTSGGYPMLVNLLLFYLEVNEWKLTKQQIIDFISIPKKSDVQDYVNRKVRDILTDVHDLQLLSRLSLYWRPFSEDDAVALAGVNPMLVTPKDRIRRLLSQRLLVQANGKLKFSPFIKKVWSPDLLEMEHKECSNVIINRHVHHQTIDVLDADNAILLLLNAKEYERAGWLYITVMSKFIETKCKEAKPISFLTMLWKDMPLPLEMSVYTRTFIRILQIQLSFLVNDDCAYATEDLIRLIEQYPAKDPMKAIASCFAIGQLSQSGNLQRALPLLQYVQPVITPDLNDEYMTVIKEQQDIAEKLPVLMLASIKSQEELFQWFDRIEETGISADCVDADAVKYALNRVVTIGNEEAILNSIIERTKNIEPYRVFLIVAVARLLLFYSDQKRYADAWELYINNKELEQTPLGSVYLNNAIACYYHDNNDTDKALQCWSAVCTEEALSLCPDEVMFACATMSGIYSQNKDYPSAVKCLETIVKNPAFGAVLLEYQQMQMHGELAIAYWNNGQRIESFEQLLIIHHYLYAHRVEIDDNYKLLELKFGICVQQYHYYLEKRIYAEAFAKPVPTLFHRPNEQFLEVYNTARVGTNIMYLFMMAAALRIPKETALLLAHRTIECFDQLIKDKNVACGLLCELNPLLLEYGDYESADYLAKSTLGLTPGMQDALNPVRLVCYLPLLPFCLKKVIDATESSSDRIEAIIESHIQESSVLFPDDKELLALKDVLINHNYAKYSDLKDDSLKICARMCNFEQLDVLASINVIIIGTMFFIVHRYYADGLLRNYVYHHAKYVISKFASNYRSLYKNPLEELENVQTLDMDDLAATKKMIRLLVAFSKTEVPLTPEHENFLEK